jgi:anti-sigma factor RsiW
MWRSRSTRSGRGTVIDRPLSCADLARLLSAYLDGELDATTARWAADHLDVCGDCAPGAAALAELRSALRGLGVPPAESVRRLRAWVTSVPATPPGDGPGPG